MSIITIMTMIMTTNITMTMITTTTVITTRTKSLMSSVFIQLINLQRSRSRRL